MSKFTKKVSTVLVSVATVVSLSGAGALVPVAYGATTAELQAQINALLAQVAALQSQLSGSTVVSGTVPASLLSSGNLTVGSKGTVVSDLQTFLGMSTVTGYFGSLTKAALAKWQAANGVSPAAGYFGPVTRAKLATVGGTTGTGTTPAPVVGGSGLTVTLASDQPSASLAPYNATRIPFTRVSLTASADGAVTVTGLTIQRMGLSEDAALAGVVLLDENGIQLGLEKTLNSDHTVTVGESVTVNAGQTRTFTVAARRAAAGSRGGQTVALAVTAVNTAAKVNASFPLTGTTHTVNETLTVGSLTNPVVGPADPGSSQTKEIGTTNYTFSSIRVTAGSAEKVILKSIRWNQSGSAAKADLANVKSYVDGVGYDTVVSADGKFYTSTFGSGLLIDKGFNKEITIKGDVIGGSARKIDFDIDKRSDLYAIGDTFGYGILPADGTDTSGTDDGGVHNTNPWFDAFEVHISAGTMAVSKWSDVSAQNVAINLADQPVGGWTVDVKGEPISVGQFVFNLAVAESTGGDVGLDDFDSIKLIDSTGKTLAGPIDPSSTSADGAITFTDTITFPVGITNLKMVAKLATDFANNDTIAASTTPSTGWSSVTGQTTGNSITPSPTSAVTGNTMTVKAAALSITVSSVPIAQTVIAGTNQFEFAKYILDTSSSGEDLRLTSLPVEYNVGAGATATDLTNCYLYDGAVKLNSSTVVNPSAAGSSTSFVFDGTGLTLVKGSSKQLSLKCNLKSGATANGTYSWGYDSGASPSPTGLVSGQSVAAANLTENDSAGQSMIVATGGTLNIALDVASPYLIASPGQEVTLAKLKYTATVEDVDVKSVALQLSGVASNTPINLVGQMVSLYDGVTPVGTATFTSGDTATSTLTGQFRVAKDGFKILTVKGTVAGISASGPMTKSGDLVKVDYDGDNEGTSTYTGGNYGTGAQSGSQINPTNNDTSSTGVRVMKAYPTVSAVALSSTLLSNGTKDIYKFKVTANNGEIALAKLSFTISSSSLTATATTFALYAYTDSGFSSADAQLVTTGLFNAGSCYNGIGTNTLIPSSHLVEIYPDATGCHYGTTTFRISAGESRWFRLQASISSVVSGNTSESFTVQLDGDAAFPVAHQLDGLSETGEMGISGIVAGTGVEDASNNDFVWSPRSTSTSASLSDLDWTNGYGVAGLPGTNLDQATLSK